MSSLKDVSLKNVGLKDVSLKDVLVPKSVTWSISHRQWHNNIICENMP